MTIPQGYRKLRPGEIIADGDSWFDANFNIWRPRFKSVGMKITRKWKVTIRKKKNLRVV